MSYPSMRIPKHPRLALFICEQLDSGSTYAEMISDLNDELMYQATLRNKFNKSKLADVLGMNRATVKKMIDEFERNERAKNDNERAKNQIHHVD